MRLTQISWSTALALLMVLGGGCSKQARLERHLKRADGYFQQGDYERARLEYLNAVKLEPGQALAIERLGMIYQDQGALLQAAPFLRKAKETNPGHADLRARLAVLHAAVGDWKTARDEAFAALDLVPDLERAVLLLADAPGKPEDLEPIRQRLTGYRQRAGEKAVFLVGDAARAIRQGNAAVAEETVRRALGVDPKSAAAHFLLANLLWARTNLAAADEAFAASVAGSPLRSARRIRHAEFKLRTGAVSVGRQMLEELAGKGPDYLPALAALAEVAFEEKRYEDCLKLTENILGRYPLHLEARMLSARVHLLQRQPTVAIAELEAVAKVYGKSPLFRYQLALACLMNNESVKAMLHLQEALAAQPDYPEAQLLQARLQLAQGEPDAAIAGLAQLVRTRPQLDRGHLMLGEAYAGRGRLNEAQATYQGFARAFPSDPRGPFLLGLMAQQQSRTNEARRCFEQALQLQPKFLPAVSQLVQSELRAGETAKALARAQAFTVALPELGAGHFLLGQAQLAAGQRAAAESSFKQALALDPEARAPYLALANLYQEARQTDQALAQLDAVIGKNPKDVGALLLKATIHQEAGQIEPARAAYELLLQSQPNSIPALNNLAYLYSEKLNAPDKAFPHARKAYDLRPGEPHTADTLGWIYHRRGDYAQAVRLLLESAEKLPEQPEVQYHLGLAHYMMGHAEPARTALERAVAAPGEFPGKAEAVERLAMLRLDVSKSDPDVLHTLESRVKEQPGDLIALLKLGGVYERQAQYAQARQAYEDVLKINPQSGSAAARLALLYAEHFNDRPRAQALARQARDAAPADPQVAWIAGRVALAGGDPTVALAALQDARQRLADTPGLTLDLAQAQYLAGRLTEADALAKAAAAAPGPHQESARQLGWLIQAYGNPAAAAGQAESQVRALAAAMPDSVPAQMALGAVCEQKGQAAEAREAYAKVLDRVPSFVLARRHLAVLFAGPLKDDRRAYEEAVKAREALPGDSLVARTLGILVYRRSDYRYAAQLLQEAAKERPADGELFFHLGMAHRQLKQHREATQALQRAIELGPNAGYAAEARRVAADIAAGK